MAIQNHLTINTDMSDIMMFSNKKIYIDNFQLEIHRDKLTHSES